MDFEKRFLASIEALQPADIVDWLHRAPDDLIDWLHAQASAFLASLFSDTPRREEPDTHDLVLVTVYFYLGETFRRRPRLRKVRVSEDRMYRVTFAVAAAVGFEVLRRRGLIGDYEFSLHDPKLEFQVFPPGSSRS